MYELDEALKPVIHTQTANNLSESLISKPGEAKPMTALDGSVKKVSSGVSGMKQYVM